MKGKCREDPNESGGVCLKQIFDDTISSLSVNAISVHVSKKSLVPPTQGSKGHFISLPTAPRPALTQVLLMCQDQTKTRTVVHQE